MYHKTYVNTRKPSMNDLRIKKIYCDNGSILNVKNFNKSPVGRNLPVFCDGRSNSVGSVDSGTYPRYSNAPVIKRQRAKAQRVLRNLKNYNNKANITGTNNSMVDAG